MSLPSTAQACRYGPDVTRTVLLTVASVGACLAVMVVFTTVVGPRAGALVGATVLLGGLAVGVALAVRGPMIEVRWDAEHVAVTPIGFRRALAVSGTVTIPWSALTSVEVVAAEDVRLGMRLPGTAMPGVLVAGSFGTGSSRTFAWYRKRAARCLLLTARTGSYRRVLVEVQEPDRLAAEITAAAPASPTRP